jgi:hypothetical protein
MTIVAFAEREDDLAEMAIHRLGDGRLVARRRTPEDKVDGMRPKGAFDDAWIHVRSKGRYIRHDVVFDEERGIECYDYSSLEHGRLWIRAIGAWHEIVEGRPRFERIEIA